MIKKILLIIKENGLIVLGAAILASGIFYVVKSPDIFMASVLSLQEKTFVAEKGRDIAYKTNSGAVDIFVSATGEIPQMIDFTISFDKDTITTDTQNTSGQGTRTISNPDDNSIIIQSTLDQTIDKNQSIIIVPFTGDIQNILVSEAVAKTNDGKTKNLSIGLLNEITSHSSK